MGHSEGSRSDMISMSSRTKQHRVHFSRCENRTIVTKQNRTKLRLILDDSAIAAGSTCGRYTSF